MANLKEVRTRITSVSSTQQITRAMKMVSASKLRKAQNVIVGLRPYAIKLKEILENLCSSLSPSENIYSRPRDVSHVLLIAITSNRGLCGAFNSNVIKRTNKLAFEKHKNHRATVLCIGKKATDFFKKTELGIIGPSMPKRLHELFDDLTYDNVASVAEKIMTNYVLGDYDMVELVYNSFKNASVQVLTVEQFLPVLLPGSSGDIDDKELPDTQPASKYTSDYLFEPDKEEIVKELIPKSLNVQLYKALLESHAAEHGARMTAMHKATENASDLLKDLKLSYNKARQAAITNEILEIVGGAEALSN